MVAFNTREDVGNRALQHCGAIRMGVLGFSEASKNASEVSFVYDKAREAELQDNLWSFATKRQILRAIDANTMLLAPAMWAQATTYFRGSIVADQSGGLWISNIPNNLGNDPLLTNYWDPYFGPMTVSLYATGSYFAGELVYTAPGNGTALVYLSLQNGNQDVPATATAYAATTTYFKNTVVTYLGTPYMSLIDLNTGNTPSLSPALFDIAASYAIGNTVRGSDNVIYSSVINANLGNDPVLDAVGTFWTNTGVLCPWTTVFVGGTGSSKWLLIGGTGFPMGVGLTTLNIVYPIGAGPSSQSISRNVFRLPAAYLRQAPQNPKPGLNPLGGPSGVTYKDWLIESDYLISAESGPIMLRFIANVTDVRRMHIMFSEALAARIGLEVCEPITQSSTKLGTIAKIYDEWINKAKLNNAIEDGFVDPPDDDFLSVRN